MPPTPKPPAVDSTAVEDAEVVPSPASEQGFPVGSYKEAVRHLRRPFTPAAVKFKAQAHIPKADPKRTLFVAYIDARLVSERLNLVLPHLWSTEYVIGQKGTMCHLTVDGITRSDIGEASDSPQGASPKAVLSDSLKRAAVHFGVGVSLYAVPSMVLPGKITAVYDGDQVDVELRKRYAAWLDATGIRVFGEPLDHGDVEPEPTGDDAAAESPAPAAAAPAPPTPQAAPPTPAPAEDVPPRPTIVDGGLKPEDAERIYRAMKEARPTVGKLAGWFSEAVGQPMHPHWVGRDTLRDTLQGLNYGHAIALWALIEKYNEEQHIPNQPVPA